MVTYRSGFPLEMIEKLEPSLDLGFARPGRPEDFGVPELVRYAAKLEIPVFGVCLGLQGMVEAFGGELGVLDYPMHGKPSPVSIAAWAFSKACPRNSEWAGIIPCLLCGRSLPTCLEMTAESEDGVIMGVRHREFPWKPCIHPESILTLDGGCGLKLMENVVKCWVVPGPAPVLGNNFGATALALFEYGRP